MGTPAFQVPLKDKSGNVIGTFGIARDITENKQAEEELNRLSTAVKSISEGVVITDITGRIVDLNEAAVIRHGAKSREELLGRNSFEMIVPEEQAKAFEGMQAVVEGGYIRDWEYTLITDDGRILPSEMSVSRLIDSEGNITGFVGIIRDLSERKQMEEERFKASKLESIGTLAGGIAHDFNNIIQNIFGSIPVIKHRLEGQDEKTSSVLERMENACIKAINLTQQLLTFSKGGAPAKETASIEDVVREFAVFSLRGSNVQCEFSFQEDLLAVEIDSNRIGRVIQNMVINADQSMPEGGVLEISSENFQQEDDSRLPLAKGKYVKIVIRDQGIGIPREYLPKIFDPYFSTKQSGSGLGLATSYYIINNHGGCIDVEAEVGVGSTFSIYIPASERDASVEEEEKKSYRTGSGRVLVMDDDEMVIETMEDMLSILGYEAEFVRDGEGAIELYQESFEAGNPFDSVILDLTVPGAMGGKEAIKKLLKIDPKIKAIVASGYSENPVMANYKFHGFSGVIVKPFNLKQLGEALINVLEK